MRLEVGEEGICETPDIGNDLMFEILVRLPIKSLLRLKSVSKYWFQLISSPEFIKFHLRNACDDPKVLLIEEMENDEVGNSEPGIALRQVPFLPTLYDYEHGPPCDQLKVDISHPMEFLEKSVWDLTFVGSCSGLVCIAVAGLNHRVIVWSPALGKCERLPCFGHGSPVKYGFGYDEASDDFKVVGIRNTPKTLVKIYSARTNSWKKLQEDDFVVAQVVGYSHGCLLNGKLHWATNKGVIFTVDLSSERFGVLEPPDCTWDLECCRWSVHAAGEFLAVFCFYKTHDPSGRSAANLWLMERYGVKESWTRVCDDATEESWTRVSDDGTDPRHAVWSVFMENTTLCHMLWVTLSEPREVWWPIPTPGHMTGNGIVAFLLHSSKQYSFNDVPNLYLFIWRSTPLVVYVESLNWPYL